MLKELLQNVHSEPSKTELGVLLEQNSELSEKKDSSAMEVNTTKLKTYEVSINTLWFHYNYCEYSGV